MLPIDAPFYRAEDALRRIPGVRGVGLAHKQVDGAVTNKVAFIVFVEKKVPRRELPASLLVPRWFEGVPTDVWEPLPNAALATSVVQGGVKVKCNRGEEGTVCCLATRGSGTTLEQFILTAHHVIYEGQADSGPGGDVGSPDLSCCWICATGKVADVTDGIGVNDLDCAIAKLNGNRPARQRIVGLGPTLAEPSGQNADMLVGVGPSHTVDQGFQSPVALNEHVRKVGTTTGLTGGLIFGLNMSLDADPDAHLSGMNGQIVVSPLQDEGHKEQDGKFHFCSYGDSGAAIMNDHNQIVGLLHRAPGFAGPTPGFPTPQPWWGRGGAFTDINKVTAALNIAIPPSATGATQSARAIMSGGGLFRMPRLTPAEQQQRGAIEGIKNELRRFPLGRRLVEFIEKHQPEIARLVNHDRRFTLAWHRAHGPQFVARVLRDLDDPGRPLPRAMEGTTIEQGFEALRAALEARGSADLGGDLAPLWPPVREAIPRSQTLRALVDNLREGEANG